MLTSAGMTLPGVAAHGTDCSVLGLLAGDVTVLDGSSSIGEGGGPHSAGHGKDGRGECALGESVARSGARRMLLSAIVHNVQFDWKATWKGVKRGDEHTSKGSASLLVSALREIALIDSSPSPIAMQPSPPATRDAERAPRAGQALELTGSRHGALTEEVEAAASQILLAQARKQAEADLLLMCCHRLSPFLPRACTHRPFLNTEQDCEGVRIGGWWTRPRAVKSRAMARLVRKSAVSSPRGQELLCRIEKGACACVVLGLGLDLGVSLGMCVCNNLDIESHTDLD